MTCPCAPADGQAVVADADQVQGFVTGYCDQTSPPPQNCTATGGAVEIAQFARQAGGTLSFMVFFSPAAENTTLTDGKAAMEVCQAANTSRYTCKIDISGHNGSVSPQIFGTHAHADNSSTSLYNLVCICYFQPLFMLINADRCAAEAVY